MGRLKKEDVMDGIVFGAFCFVVGSVGWISIKFFKGEPEKIIAEATKGAMRALAQSRGGQLSPSTTQYL